MKISYVRCHAAIEIAWEAAYVVRYESYDLIVKREHYVKSQNMKITLHSVIPCRSQNVTYSDQTPDECRLLNACICSCFLKV